MHWRVALRPPPPLPRVSSALLVYRAVRARPAASRPAAAVATGSRLVLPAGIPGVAPTVDPLAVAASPAAALAAAIAGTTDQNSPSTNYGAVADDDTAQTRAAAAERTPAAADSAVASLPAHAAAGPAVAAASASTGRLYGLHLKRNSQ